MSSSSSVPSLVRVVGVAQSYDWGKRGNASSVGQLMAAAADAAAAAKEDTAPPAFQVDGQKPYAELWMGTHPSGPSTVRLTGGRSESLQEHLGGASASLPFLFKVLSVGKALSIQAHPDASLARQLHASRPDVYKDDQHKPELACALTPFEALCAFRPLGQIAQHAREYPELRALLGEELAGRLQREAGHMGPEDVGTGASADGGDGSGAARKALLKDVFAALMTPKPELLQEQLAALLARLQAEGQKASVPSDEAASSSASSSSSGCTPLAVAPLLLRLSAQYPGDVGIFAPLVLNAFAIPPGGAIFLGPSEPHAYLAGECIECMACSDNVVRAGLTPKLRDTDVLLSMLTYRESTPQDALMQAKELAPGVREFAPPKEFSEFRLLRAEVAQQEKEATVLPAVPGPSILLTFSGEGHAQLDDSQQPQVLRRGDVFLVPAGAAVQLRKTGGDASLLVFQCTANNA